MTKNDFEYECMRAELLGLEKPDWAEFEQKRDQIESEVLASDNEQMGRVSGGLDELNARIDSTKRKLTRYQSFHRKIGKLFRSKSKTDPQLHSDTPLSSGSEGNLPLKTGRFQPTTSSGDSQYKSSLNFEEYERQNDKLDALLNKAERAELSLNRNNQLIRKVINK